MPLFAEWPRVSGSFRKPSFRHFVCSETHHARWQSSPFFASVIPLPPDGGLGYASPGNDNKSSKAFPSRR